MSLTKSWDVNKILHDLRSCSYQINDTRNDGFTAWTFKKELYDVLFLAEDLLEKSPKFGNYEDKLLKEREQNKLLNKLKQ